MRLVGVASLSRGGGEVGGSPGPVDQGDEALEPEHPPQRARPVADRRLAAPPELALADPQPGGNQIGLSAGLV